MIAEPVTPRRWASAAAALLDQGYGFRTLYAAGEGAARSLFVSPSGERRLLSTRNADRLPSLVELAPAAGWSEREASDTHHLEFSGHEPLRPLLQHPADGHRWRVPVTGEGVHEVAVGPIHAGVIESGHFRFHVVGERILLLDLRLFYKHRGLERAAEGVEIGSGIAYAQRACAACAVANSVAYAQAAEELLGLAPGPELARARTVLLELERLYNHLHDLSAISAGVGFAAGAMAFAALKEQAQRLNARLSGHRFLFGSIQVGRSPVEVSGEMAAQAAAEVARLGDGAASTWKEMLFNASVQDRFSGAGVLTHADADRLGAVGPAARASGIAADARSCGRGLCYPSFEPALLQDARGDVAARAEIRHLELQTTCSLLSGLLGEGALCVDEAGPGPVLEVGIGQVESPRGETVCCLEARAGKVARLHLRTASFSNWPALAEAVAGSILPEFPLINKSFELCYACVDR